MSMAILLGAITGATERYSEQVDTTEKQEVKLEIKRQEGRALEKVQLQSTDNLLALPVSEQIRFGLLPVGSENRLYGTGKNFVLPNVVSRGANPQQSMANLFGLKMPDGKSFVSSLDPTGPLYEKTKNTLAGEFSTLMKDFREKGEMGKDLNFQPIVEAIGYWDYKDPRDRLMIRDALTQASNQDSFSAQFFDYVPEDPKVSKLLSAIKTGNLSKGEIELLGNAGVDVTQFSENEDTQTLSGSTYGFHYQNRQGVKVTPVSIDPQHNQVMLDVSNNYSGDPSRNTQRYASIFKASQLIKEDFGVPEQVFVNTFSDLQRLKNNEVIRVSGTGVIYGGEQLAVAMAPVYYGTESFGAAIDVFRLGYMSLDNVYYDRLKKKGQGPNAIDTTITNSVPIFLKNIGYENRAELQKSYNGAGELYTTSRDLLALVTNPVKEGDPASGPAILGPLGVLDQAILRFQTFGEELNQILGTTSSAYGENITDRNHYLFGVDDKISMLQKEISQGSTETEAQRAVIRASRAQLAVLLRKKLAYTFAKSLESSTGNSRLSDTDVRISGIAQGLEGLLANSKTAPTVLRYMMRSAQKEMEYKEKLLTGSMEEMQAAEALKIAFSGESMLRIGDKILNSDNLTKEQIAAMYQEETIAAINKMSEHDPDFKKQEGFDTGAEEIMTVEGTL